MTQPNGWKTAFLLLLMTLLGVIGVAGYLILDQSVTLTYMEEGYEDTLDDFQVLMKVFPDASSNIQRSDLVFLLRKQNPEAFITDNSEGVGVGFLQFEFDARGKLKKVSNTQHPESSTADPSVQ